MKSEINRAVEEIFSPVCGIGQMDEPMRIGLAGGGQTAEALSQIEVRAGCDLSTDQPQHMTSVTQEAGCDLQHREKGGSYLTREQRMELERQLNDQAGVAAIRTREPEEEAAVKHAQLKVVGVNLEGLLNYRVHRDGITIEADGVLIEAEEIGELLEELKRVSEIREEMKEADV